MRSRFATDERGQVAIIFALMLLPLIAMIGAAIDYGAAHKMRTQMQAAIDAAGVAAVDALLRGTPKDKLPDVAKLNYEQALGFGVPGEFDALVLNDDHLTASASGTSSTYILGLVGVTEFDVSVETYVRLARKSTPDAQAISAVTDALAQRGGTARGGRAGRDAIEGVADQLEELTGSVGRPSEREIREAQQALEDMLNANPELQQALKDLGARLR